MAIRYSAKLNKNCNSFPPGIITPSTVVPIDQIQKFDSVHDFGSTRGNNLATDSISKSKDTGNPYAYDQMRLSFIQKYSFPLGTPLGRQIPDINIQNYSNFSFPGAGQIPRIVDDIENFLLIGGINNAIREGLSVDNGNFLCRPTKPQDTFQQTKRDLTDFFASYNDTTGTGKINFIVDTPGDLTKVLRSDKRQDNFAYVLTQESAHDSAKGKPTTLSPIVIDEAYNGNGFCEAFTTQRRNYEFTADSNGPGTFESNFTITFTGMKYVRVAGKENFNTDVEYRKQGFNQVVSCPLNGLVHPTNVPQITKAVTLLTKASGLFLKPVDKQILETHSGNFVDNFYTSFINPSNRYDYTQDNQNSLDFNFTKKRAGDGLQARICQYINSGNIQLQCYKKRQSVDPVGNVEAGLYKGTVYTITKLILVTIDRVLFSYCIINNIPAIYSGTDFFIFFKPPPATVFRRGGMPLLPQPIKTYSKKSARHEISKKGGIIQKGGDIVDEFYDVINDIPYIIFKLLPRILNKYERSEARNLVLQAIELYKSIDDDAIITYYGNNASLLIYKNQITTFSDTFPRGVTDNTIIYLESQNRTVDCKLDFLSAATGTADYQFTYKSITFRFSNADIKGILANIEGVMTRANLDDLILRTNLSGTFLDSILSQEGTNFSQDEINASPSGGKKQSAGSNKNLLDLYTTNMVSSENLLNNDKLKEENLIALLSYINIFTCYEVSFCYDNEIYDQKFINENGLEVTKNIGLYIMYDLLLNDFLQQNSKISYSLLEYFINSGDTTQRYLSISTDMMETLQYVYCDDVRLDKSLDKKIEEQIQNQTINTSDPIFVASQTYFAALFDRIDAKQAEVQAYLDGTNTDPNIRNYIKNNLSMYGFMNMTNNFVNSLSPAQSSSSSQGVARGLQPQNLSYPTGEERRKQIESQRSRSPSALKPQQQRKTGVYTLSDFPKPKGEEVGQTVPVYAKSIGGKYITNKNNRKNRKTRKNRKIIKKNRNIRKTKKQINRRTRRN